jgi:hypothetical protein
MYTWSVKQVHTIFDIFRTVHLRVILVGNQLDAQFIIRLFESSTCFEQLCAHPQEENCINTTSGIITPKISEWSKITKITRIHRGCSHDVF